MGTEIEKTQFCNRDYIEFSRRLSEQLKQLKTQLNSPSFGTDSLKIGAELEMYLVGDNGQASAKNQQLLMALCDEQYQPELNQYNIELNLSPVDINNAPFSTLLEEIQSKTKRLEEIAKQQEVNIVPIGILPTLTGADLDDSNMTETKRYRCLAEHLYQARGEDFKININGEQSLNTNLKDICAEGANTSFQVHLMVPKEQLESTFNAAMLTAPLVIATCANSPIFLGKSLWDETRIALFKQSLDVRLENDTQWQQPTRVNFGHGWIRNSIWEYFAEAVALYPPLLPYLSQDSAVQNDIPELKELLLHVGTIWPWHRPVYCANGNGHVRIEFRTLPAGPTSIDMVANAAFAIGMSVGMNNKINEIISQIPFKYAEYNFYRAAQNGLSAIILWPCEETGKLIEQPISEILKKYVTTAKEGLKKLNIPNAEIDRFLSVIEHRLETQTTGATWQKETLRFLRQTNDNDTACQKLLALYLENIRTCKPVSTWSKPWL